MPTPSAPEMRAVLPAVAIVGTDTVLAAAPATAVQVAHACLARGFDVAIPASWGDELVAAEMVRRLAKRERGPAVACTCPFVRARLQAGGADLSPFLVSIAPPPVALARYLRVLYGARGVRISYVGACPAGSDASIDERLEPMEFFAQLARHGISLVDQPRVFDSVVPPDRRRWCSLPGGVPAPELLWSEGGARALVEIAGEDVSSEIAEQVIANTRALVDLAPALGCACSGVVNGTSPRDARAAVTAQEPPRALGPVIDPGVPVSFEPPPGPPPPAAPDRARGAGSAAPASPPADYGSAPAREGPRSRYWHVPSLPDERRLEAPLATPIPPTLGLLDEETLSSAALFRPDASRRRQSRRPNTANLPRARDDEGRTLPRAYVGRRRTTRGHRGATARGSDVELRLHPAVEPEVAALTAEEPTPSDAGAVESATGSTPTLAEGSAASPGMVIGDVVTSTQVLLTVTASEPTPAPAPASGPPSEPARTDSARDRGARPAAHGPRAADRPAVAPASDPSGDALRQRMRQGAAASSAEPHHVPPHVPEQDGALRTLLFLATIVACVILAVFVLLSL